MRTRPDPVHMDVVNRRLELLRAEIAHDWRADEAAVGTGVERVESLAPLVQPASGGEWWADHTRVAMPVPVDPAAGDDEPPEGPAFRPPAVGSVPVPGRHAARRMAAAALVPEQLRGRVALGPWQLAVVALGVALALAVACWWVVRGSAASVPSPAVAPASSLVRLDPTTGAAGTTGSAGAAAAPGASLGASSASGGVSVVGDGRVTIDVEGKVRQPGVKVLAHGSRVIDAIRAAGGAPRRRDLQGLNLAALLTDGQQILVGSGATAGAPAAGDGGSASAAPDAGPRVDLNTADATQLDTLPGVGPVTAQSILQWRAQHGRFTSIDQLMSVNGIGPKTYAQIESFVTV